MAAILTWRQHPTEIEVELDNRGHDIMDWHRGAMSSRRLLVLLRHPDVMGPYAAVKTDSGWPEPLEIAAAHHNQFAIFRASHYIGGDHEYEPYLFRGPVYEAAHTEALMAAELDAQESDETFLSEISDQ